MSTHVASRGRLHEKVAIVTGSSSGMGRAIATAFSNEGARIVCVDLRPEARPEIPEEATIPTYELLRKQGGQAIFVRTDVSSESDFEAAVEAAVKEFGRLDILVNNAGIVQPLAPIHETTVEQWDMTMNVNARSVFFGCKYAIRQMLQQTPSPGADRGRIINISSIAALSGRAGIPAYTASKGAVAALTRQVAADYGKDQIRCNAICPGTVQTAMLGDAGAPRPEISRNIELESSLYPLQRIGMPHEIARAALFLASEDASWVTGVLLPVDGGFLAQ